jgi:hypothetical protein
MHRTTGVVADLIDLDAEASVQRPKLIGRRAESGVSHAVNNATISADGQLNQGADPGSGQLRSNVRAVARPTGMALLRWALAPLSSTDIAAALDEDDSRVRKMLAGHLPWKAENYILLGDRVPEIGIRIIVAYVQFLSMRHGASIIGRVIQSLSDLRDGKVVVPAC